MRWPGYWIPNGGDGRALLRLIMVPIPSRSSYSVCTPKACATGGGAVDVGPALRALVALGGQEPARDEQGEGLRAVAWDGGHALRADPRPTEAPHVLDVAAGGHAFGDHDCQHLGLIATETGMARGSVSCRTAPAKRLSRASCTATADE